MARKSAYNPKKHPIIVYRLAKDGLTQEGIAERMGISINALYQYKDKHKEFREALQKGKDEFDADKVESVLLKCAMGYEYKEYTTEMLPPVKAGEKPLVTAVREFRKQALPSIDAAKHWLKTRHPERWPDKQEIQIGGIPDGEPIPVDLKQDVGATAEILKILVGAGALQSEADTTSKTKT